jgi:hypothetical protein
MLTNRTLINILARVTIGVLATLCSTANMNLTQASVAVPAVNKFPPIAARLDEVPGPVHRPLGSVGITFGQTARINVVNSPDPAGSDPPEPITVEMCFHDKNGEVILDRSRRPVQETAIIDPHQGDFLDLNGNLVAVPGARFVIIPCVRILRINRGTLAVPTVELYSNVLKTTLVLSPGTARGFDPQPDPPAEQELAFGLVGITQGVTARLYVNNAENPSGSSPREPVTIEMEFHDAQGNSFETRTGGPSSKVVILNPDQVDYLELNGNDLAALGARVGIIPCVKVLRGSASSLIVPTLEMYVNFTQQTLLLANFDSDPSQSSSIRR